jgi:hypothetical protein
MASNAAIVDLLAPSWIAWRQPEDGERHTKASHDSKDCGQTCISIHDDILQICPAAAGQIAA